MKRVTVLSYPVSIFIAGDPERASYFCRGFCDRVGLCVTVTPTRYVYRDGEEAGVIVGLINYPRFPAEPRQIANTAKELALELMTELNQQSVSIQMPDETLWLSIRNEDVTA
jgi:ferredoxin